MVCALYSFSAWKHFTRHEAAKLSKGKTVTVEQCLSGINEGLKSLFVNERALIL